MAPFAKTMGEKRTAIRSARAAGADALARLHEALDQVSVDGVAHRKGEVTYDGRRIANVDVSDGFLSVMDAHTGLQRFFPPASIGIEAAFDYVAELAGAAMEAAEQAEAEARATREYNANHPKYVRLEE